MHQDIMNALSKAPCKHHLVGLCKQKQRCRFSHIMPICKEWDGSSGSCQDKECADRHPALCFFFAFNRCRFKGKCSLLHMVQPSNNKVLAGLKEDIAALKLDNFKLRAERLDSVKETEAKVLLSNKTGLDEVKEALAVANAVAEELKEIKASLAPAMIRINEELKSQTEEKFHAMKEEISNLSCQLQQVNKASKSVDIDDLKSKSNEVILITTTKFQETAERFHAMKEEISNLSCQLEQVNKAIKYAPDWDRIEYRCGKHPYYWDKIENRCGMCTDDITNKLSKILSRK